MNVNLHKLQIIYIGVQGKLVKNLFTVIIWDRVFRQESYKVMAPEGTTGVVVIDLEQEVSIPNTR